jgi:hypothetical protein
MRFLKQGLLTSNSAQRKYARHKILQISDFCKFLVRFRNSSTLFESLNQTYSQSIPNFLVMMPEKPTHLGLKGTTYPIQEPFHEQKVLEALTENFI